MSDIIDKIISESIDKFLIMEYYGIPNGIDRIVGIITSDVNTRWHIGGDNMPFPVTFKGVPLGYIIVCPTNENLRASYAIPNNLNKPCVIFINPDNVLGDNDNGNTFHATLVHELTHMIEDIGRRKSSEYGLGSEMLRTGHMKAFDNVIRNGMLKDDNKSYSSIEKAVNRVIYYGIGFERNARNAGMFTKLMDLPIGTIKTYEDGIKFLRSTIEYQRYERSIASAWYLVNLSDDNDKANALYAVSKCSDYKFRNWNHFHKWLMQYIRKYENKMNNVIPKVINHVINSSISENV